MQGLHRDSVGSNYLPLLEKQTEKYTEIDVETEIQRRVRDYGLKGPK